MVYRYPLTADPLPLRGRMTTKERKVETKSLKEDEKMKPLY